MREASIVVLHIILGNLFLLSRVKTNYDFELVFFVLFQNTFNENNLMV